MSIGSVGVGDVHLIKERLYICNGVLADKVRGIDIALGVGENILCEGIILLILKNMLCDLCRLKKCAVLVVVSSLNALVACLGVAVGKVVVCGPGACKSVRLQT